jgi:DNA adenine methylase
MRQLPFDLARVGVPPIKCQGIKTKLVPFLLRQIHWSQTPDSRWIEPFLGSGVVAFNVAPERALLTDTNRHIIRFYQAIQSNELDRAIVRDWLTEQGQQLARLGADYYYEVRSRFNQTAAPLDFLFLNRACFNGLMRFNRRGEFNVPFCRKPQRFAPSYVTKIANQVNWVAEQLRGKAWEFQVASWQETLQTARAPDFIYLDPPYIGRHSDYYTTWTLAEAKHLATIARQVPCGLALSMWLENQHRRNLHLQNDWADWEIHPFDHFYHVGSQETWRGAIVEALLLKPGSAVLTKTPVLRYGGA